MTSNLGSGLIRERFEKLTAQNREQIIESAREEVFELLKQSIRPEFLNRIDELIMFTPLSEKEIRQIVELQLNLVQKQLDTNSIRLDISDKAIAWIAHEGFDPQYGARPVKRVLQRSVLNELSRKLIAGEINPSQVIQIDVENGELHFTQA